MNFQLAIITILIILCDIITQSTSMYDEVSWNEKQNQSQAEFYIHGKKRNSYFDNEIDSTKQLNKLCGKIEIIPQNSEICDVPNQQERKPTSKYRNVYWKRDKRKWCVQFWKNGEKQFGGCFNDELDAAKRVNQLCQEMQIPSKNPAISAMPNQQYQKKEKTSQYKGVHWETKTGKWKVHFCVKADFKLGGMFNDELDAAKRVNQLCEDLGIPHQNSTVSTIPNKQKKEKMSQYKGVTWHNKSKKWYAQLTVKGKSKYGGMFNDELDAAKSVNQLCKELGISPHNPGISAIPDKKYQKKEKTSQYKGVHWETKADKWKVHFCVTGEKTKYGGMFNVELDAAKRVNQLCEDLEIPYQNPTVSAIPNQKHVEKKKKKSQYQGVYWKKNKGKWFVAMTLHGGGKKYGGSFNDEADAGKKVNQLCQEMGISLQNPTISMVPEHKYQKTLRNYAIQTEFASLINILDKNNDPIAATITKYLLEAINYGEQMTQINLYTKNGESALSIAAKHGLPNTVKFLISKGADKEHFTHEHHTPLSLAVSHNHLKVVQVLFEDWISPNSHEKPYLHLAPIFNVKSRKIAQLLIDNDAVTHEIYNNKNQSPLTVACQNGYLDVVEFFLDDGLDVNHLDNDNKTPLFYAFANKHIDVVSLLISKGA